MIFISGIPSAGKTTLAGKLGEYLHRPVLTTDHVYYVIARHLGKTDDGEIREFGNPKVWLGTKNIASLKKRFYSEYLAPAPDKCILEGYGLCFAEDREAIGIEPEEHFQLDVGYEEWLKHRDYEHTLERREEYDYLIGLVDLPEESYRIGTDTDLCIRDEKVYSGLYEGFVADKFGTLRLGDLTGKSVLDLGGNDGSISRLCLEAGATDVLVVDSNWRHLQRAKGLNRYLLDLNHIEKLQGQWDVVLSVSMIHYLPDQERFIRGCARLAKERFILELPVLQEQGFKTSWDRPEGTIKPTPALVRKWLDKYFTRVEMVGSSVSPDSSHRLVFHAWK